MCKIFVDDTSLFSKVIDKIIQTLNLTLTSQK